MRVGLVMLAGCYIVEPKPGDDQPGPPPPQDATSPADDSPMPPPLSVFEVPCGNEAAFVESTGGFRFSPQAVTISAGDSVHFTNAPSHSIVPVFPDSDDGLRVDFGATTCLVFTQPGTFDYRCGVHTTMTGVVTVNP